MAEGVEGQETAQEIPASEDLMSDALKAMPGMEKEMAYFAWPSPERISGSLRPSDETLSAAEKKLHRPNWITTRKVSVTEAKRMAEHWIRTTLKDRWVPTDIHSRLIALDSDIGGHDAIWVRYQVESFYIQIAQTNPQIAIIIKPTDGARLLPHQIIDLLFARSAEIKENTLSQAEHFPDGCSRAEPPNHLENPESRNEYWGNTYWWSDGICLASVILKFYGGAGLPIGLPRDWF